MTLRHIIINGILGGVLGACLPTVDNIAYWVGMFAAVGLIINNQVD